jgi:hypothetical protein
VFRLARAQALRDHFLGWQCRIRQHAVRQQGGRPGPGMRPRALLADGTVLAEAVTVLIVPREPTDTIYRFRHVARRKQDPAERFQMTALFDSRSELASALLAAPGCLLDFSQFSQRYRVPCAAAELPLEHPAWQHTYWHNLLFNPALPPNPRILSFSPHWAEAEADPPIG